MPKREMLLGARLPRYVADFIRVLRIEEGASTHTCDAYERDLVHFVGVISRDSDPSDTLGVDALRAYVRYLGHQEYAVSSVQRKMAAVKRFCRYLYLQGVVDTDFSSSVRVPTVARDLPLGVSVDGVQALLVSPGAGDRFFLRDKALLALLYGAGLRVSELCGVALSHLAPDLSWVRVSGKGGKERVVPLPDLVSQWVQLYIRDGRSEIRFSERGVWLFLSRGGKKMSRQSVFHLVRKYGARVGMPTMYPHQLRHAFATHLLDRDVSVRDVQVSLGHAQLSTTQRYLSVSTSHMRRVYQRAHPLAGTVSGDVV